jgi:hypothetical protein
MFLRTIYRTWEEAVREIVTQLLAYEQKVTTDLSDHVADTAAAHAASAIANTPAGNIAATTVQAALNELDSEKALLAGSATQDFTIDVLTVATAAGSTIAIETATAPTLLNSWTIDNQAVGYWKDAYGVVHIHGTVTGGTLGTVIFTLPSGYRPPAERAFANSATLAFGAIVIAPAGDVTHAAGGTSNVYLDGISFRTT